MNAGGSAGLARGAWAAPPTARDALRRAPRTTRDPAPETTRDRGPVAGARYRRVNLPPELVDRYEVERDLGAGGEADTLLARDRATGEHAVVKIYRREVRAAEATLARLTGADPRHLVRLLDWGRGDGYLWETLEYAVHGSLEDLRRQQGGGAWPDESVLRVVAQVAPAIAYAHSLGLVHRDVKPGNILVRGVAPVDLVLADFGLAAVLNASREMRSGSRTCAYAAPEAAIGDTSTALDWWSLGIVVHELLTGLNPFQRLDGSWQSDAMIVRELTVHDIDLSRIRDRRWHLLCRGLLTRAPEERWGAEQVSAWCAGASPAVPRSHPAGPAGFAGGPLDREHLLRLAENAVADPAQNAAVDLLYTDGVLPALDGRPGCAGHAALDERWRRLWAQFEAVVRRYRLDVPPETARRYRAMLLLAAFPGQEELWAAEAGAAAAEPEAAGQRWFRTLAAEQAPPDAAAAHHAALLLAAPIAAERTGRQRTAERVRAAEAARQRQFARERSIDELSARFALVCAMLALVPLLGYVAAPAALYLGYRGRRGGEVASSTLTFALAVVGLVCNAFYARVYLGITADSL
ncbi:hypothetical protein Val02_52460 [Virgisporangium aliadipatigenens]|uniref:Protein kinase domain-containing protein n=1 Tax=Virgisporangium aliadipatigenens TaxID=741659 RepID=A0A8J3YQX8_9ACTN|nr:serine/threonine-protein kinase [Virgisporangium aliadipatigenens]GIJ48360.1 hypothetical protein Val02_52460 [Virgisporangium aliadipatigenens]